MKLDQIKPTVHARKKKATPTVGTSPKKNIPVVKEENKEPIREVNKLILFCIDI